MGDTELSVLQRYCLYRRIADQQTLKQESASWQQQRNSEKATIDWRFLRSDAWAKLKRLYPSQITLME